MSLLLIIDHMVSSHDPRLAELIRLAVNTMHGSQVLLNLTFSFRCILHRVLPNLTDFVTRQMFSEFPSKISSSLFNHLSTLVVNPNRDSLRMARISFYLHRHLVHM